MSRLLVICLSGFALAAPAAAQTITDGEMQARLAKQKSMVSIDRNGCIRNPEDAGKDIIVVCGPDEEAERQKLPNEGPIDTDRIRRGEAISTKRAAAQDWRNCGVIGAGLGCTQLPRNWMKGDYSPPYPPDFDEVIKGLPDQEQVEAAKQRAPTPE